MTSPPGDARADRIAARTTGGGVGLLVFMIVWLIGVRITEKVWGPPSSAVVAIAIAASVGIVVSVVAGHQLVSRQRSEAQGTREPMTLLTTEQQ